MSKPRVRFAPSPTGLLHLGGLRTALFNWLFAKNQQGTFIWRVEDTDRDRYVQAAVDNLVESLRWLGLDWDEGPEAGGKSGPYFQSERLKIYKKYADELLSKGLLYRDWTTKTELEKLRREAQIAKQPFIARQSLLHTKGEPQKAHVLRFKIGAKGQTTWEDLIRGSQSWQNSTIDDFIVIKSDGYPTYNFANVIDDHLMNISHVIRGDEFLASTPKHLQLYKALGWKPPLFAHLPQVLGPDGRVKLSKRHGAEPATVYRDLGYLPEAVINFLATLGWNDGTTQEVYRLTELVKRFKLTRVQKSPAVFDKDRLTYLNGVHIRRLSIDELAARASAFWPKQAKDVESEHKKRVLKLVQERLKYLAELPELTDFFFVDPKPNKKLLSKINKSDLRRAADVLATSTFSEADLETRLRQVAVDSGTKPGELFGSIRLAVTGKTAAPGLFETLAVIGKTSSLARVDRVLKIL